MELKQEISQTVNVVTEVKKEIVNLQDSINDFYSQLNAEMYRSEDLGKRVKICDNGQTRLVCFVLNSIPVEKSLTLSFNWSQIRFKPPPLGGQIYHSQLMCYTS
jgi:hypothetical protein